MMKSFISEICQLPSAESIQITCVTDNQSLHGVAYSTKTMTDRRLKVDMCVARDMLQRSEIQRILWTEAGKQLSVSPRREHLPWPSSKPYEEKVHIYKYCAY